MAYRPPAKIDIPFCFFGNETQPLQKHNRYKNTTVTNNLNGFFESNKNALGKVWL
jgi:hypothetical protein